MHPFFLPASQLWLSDLEFPLRLQPILEGIPICSATCEIEFIRATIDAHSRQTKCSPHQRSGGAWYQD